MSGYMERRMITFHGGAIGKYGLPEHYHVYFVFAGPAPWLGGGGSIASVESITPAPEPSVPHFVASQGTEKDAIEKARAALRSLPGNKDLQETVFD